VIKSHKSLVKISILPNRLALYISLKLLFSMHCRTDLSNLD